MKALVLLATALSLSAAPARQSSLDAAMAAFESAWRSGDMTDIAMAPEGIQLQLPNESHSLVAARQARAALTEFRGARSTGTLEMQQAGPLSNDPSKGSASFRWQSVVQGTSEEVLYRVFVEFTRVQSSWRISAIRVLPDRT